MMDDEWNRERRARHGESLAGEFELQVRATALAQRSSKRGGVHDVFFLFDQRGQRQSDATTRRERYQPTRLTFEGEGLAASRSFHRRFEASGAPEGQAHLELDAALALGHAVVDHDERAALRASRWRAGFGEARHVDVGAPAILQR